jgi:hypothetical protein
MIVKESFIASNVTIIFYNHFIKRQAVILNPYLYNSLFIILSFQRFKSYQVSYFFLEDSSSSNQKTSKRLMLGQERYKNILVVEILTVHERERKAKLKVETVKFVGSS